MELELERTERGQPIRPLTDTTSIRQHWQYAQADTPYSKLFFVYFSLRLVSRGRQRDEMGIPADSSSRDEESNLNPGIFKLHTEKVIILH